MTHPPRGRLLVAAAVAACTTVLLLAGCGTGPGRVAAGGATPPSTVPVAVPVADATAAVDWKTAAYLALGCASREEWVAGGLPADAWDAGTVLRTAADVTGDGTDEVLVQAACPTAASTPPDHVVVLAGTAGSPTVLGVLGDDLFHPQATVTTAGATVTLSGPTVAGDDPTCCPAHRGSVTYAWDGDRFVVRTLAEVPGEGADDGTAAVASGSVR